VPSGQALLDQLNPKINNYNNTEVKAISLLTSDLRTDFKNNTKYKNNMILPVCVHHGIYWIILGYLIGE